MYLFQIKVDDWVILPRPCFRTYSYTKTLSCPLSRFARTYLWPPPPPIIPSQIRPRLFIFSFLLMFFSFAPTEILYISSRVLLYVFNFNFFFSEKSGLEKKKQTNKQKQQKKTPGNSNRNTKQRRKCQDWNKSNNCRSYNKKMFNII